MLAFRTALFDRCQLPQGDSFENDDGWPGASLRHVTSRHVASLHVTSRHVTSRHVRHVTSRRVMSRNVS